MFISLKKYSEVEELSQALLRFSHILLQAIRLHAVEGDQIDYERFESSIQGLEGRLSERPKAGEVLVAAGAAAKVLEEYNEGVRRFLRAQSAELQSMVAMLAKTLSTIAIGSERSISRLENIQRQLEKASVMEDIRNLKAQLGECLNALQEETLRQQRESTRAVHEIREEIERSQELLARGERQRSGRPPEQDQAQSLLANIFQQRRPVYAAVFVINRLELINSRFGFAVGDRILHFFRDHLLRGLSASDRVLRWDGSSFVALMQRPHATLHQVEREVARFASVKLEKTIEFESRTVLLPIACRWVVLPALDFASPQALARQIGAFVSNEAAQSLN